VGKAAEAGILIRGAEVLERKLNVVVFDKTGTLTKGEPNVTDIVPLDGSTEAAVLQLGAAVEVGSEHPLGEAIVRAANRRAIALPRVAGFEAISGQGIRGQVDGHQVLLGNRHFFHRQSIDVAGADARMQSLEQEGKTAVIVGVDGKPIGIIAVADTLKPEAREAIDALKSERIEIVLLTGDNERTAKAIARQLGIDRVIAEVLPGDKAEIIKRLQSEPLSLGAAPRTKQHHQESVWWTSRRIRIAGGKPRWSPSHGQRDQQCATAWRN
jgi:Cu+-exporting ATPase